MSGPNWDTYYPKHCARLYGWLPATKEFMAVTGKTVIKYFTLCDVQAIDVFMLEKEGILHRDPNGSLPSVIVCEGVRRKVPDIIRVVKPPLKEAVIPESLEDLLTFEDDAYTRTTSVDAYERDAGKRRRLTLKKHYERLRDFFPFDVINFDPCNSILGDNIEESRLFAALRRVFVLQKTTNKFLLFMTTPVFNIPQRAHAEFKSDLNDNLARYPALADSLRASCKTVNYDEMDEGKRTALCVAKSVVGRAARREGWECEHYGIYWYENIDGHRFLDSVAVCEQPHSGPRDSQYVRDLVGIVETMPSDYPYTFSSRSAEVRAHLKSVVDFREEQRQKRETS